MTVEMVVYKATQTGKRYVHCNLCGEYEFYTVLEEGSRWAVNHFGCWHPDRVEEVRRRMRSTLVADEFFVGLMERMMAGAKQEGLGLADPSYEIIELRGNASQRVRFTSCGHEATIPRTSKAPTCAKCRMRRQEVAA